MITYEELTAASARAADHRETYGAAPQQFGELWLPRERSSVPVVVLLHGGCWRAEYDLTHAAPTASALADAGYGVWVPEYRRVGEAGGGWPGTFDDVARAVDFVRDLASRYAVLDSTRVVLAGHSAGGQLALWAASRHASDEPLDPTRVTASARQPLRPIGVVCLAGISYLAAYSAPSGCGSAVIPLVGGTAADVGDRYRAVSPVARVPIGVPIRIVHGVADPTVPISLSREFAGKAKAAGDVVTLTEVPGAGHFDVVAPQASAWSAVLDAVRSLVAHAGP
jgi:acetyl esterase/lipase